jgi:CubicO group peptidase (beta-lactamase class C family)
MSFEKYWNSTIKNPKYPKTPITFRTLLTHTSSIYSSGEAYTYSAAKTYLAQKHYTKFAPGDISGWTYNNYAFSVLGMTLELAAGKTANTILNEQLFSKMDIDAAFGSGDIKNTGKLITLYRHDGSVARTVAVSKGHHASKTPGGNGTFFAGGFTSSAKDVAKLISILAGDGIYEGVRLMDAASVEIMETPFSKTPVSGGSYQAYPMRYWENLYNRDKIYFHTGSAYGIVNCVSYDPETGDGIVVLTTGASDKSDDYGIYKVCADINSYIYNIID